MKAIVPPLRRKLQSLGLDFEVRAGLVRQRRGIPDPNFIKGCRYVSIDLCDINDSNSHIKSLEECLPRVIDVCQRVGLLGCESQRLEMTATNAGNVIFVRRLWFSPQLLTLLSQHAIWIGADIGPCDDG